VLSIVMIVMGSMEQAAGMPFVVWLHTGGPS
jgi:hypothetical protein